MNLCEERALVALPTTRPSHAAGARQEMPARPAPRYRKPGNTSEIFKMQQNSPWVPRSHRSLTKKFAVPMLPLPLVGQSWATTMTCW
jgi:hypothetical protein